MASRARPMMIHATRLRGIRVVLNQHFFCADVVGNGRCFPIRMAHQVRTEFMQIPVVTRVYATSCVLTTLAVVRSGHTSILSYVSDELPHDSFSIATWICDPPSAALPSSAHTARRGTDYNYS